MPEYFSVSISDLSYKCIVCGKSFFLIRRLCTYVTNKISVSSHLLFLYYFCNGFFYRIYANELIHSDIEVMTMALTMIFLFDYLIWNEKFVVFFIGQTENEEEPSDLDDSEEDWKPSEKKVKFLWFFVCRMTKVKVRKQSVRIPVKNRQEKSPVWRNAKMIFF